MDIHFQELNHLDKNKFIKFNSTCFDEDDFGIKVLQKGDVNSGQPNYAYIVKINIETKDFLTNELIKSECFDNYEIILGCCELTEGVDIVIASMYKNSIVEVILKPSYAYGSLGKKPDIFPNTILLCKIELLDFHQNISLDTFEDLNDSFTHISRLKERGNFWFRRNDYSNSLRCYELSLRFLIYLSHIFTENILKNEDEVLILFLKKIKKTKIDLLNNLSQSCMKIEDYKISLDYVNCVLKIDKNNVKAMFRKAKILEHKQNIREALIIIKQALKLEPNNDVLLNELKILNKKKESDINHEKKLYKKMFSIESIKKKKYSKSIITIEKLGYGILIVGLIVGSFFIHKKVST